MQRNTGSAATINLHVQLASMAKAVSPHTWQRGFREPTSGTPWQWGPDENDGPEQYVTPPSKEVVSSPVHNDLGINVQRTWPTLYDGTNNPHGIPDWWKPASEVDVLICGGASTLHCIWYLPS